MAFKGKPKRNDTRTNVHAYRWMTGGGGGVCVCVYVCTFDSRLRSSKLGLQGFSEKEVL